jgi:hypothetical protein
MIRQFYLLQSRYMNQNSYKSEFREYESLNIINYDMCEFDDT